MTRLGTRTPAETAAPEFRTREAVAPYWPDAHRIAYAAEVRRHLYAIEAMRGRPDPTPDGPAPLPLPGIAA